MSNITIHNFFIRSSFSSYCTSGWDQRGPNGQDSGFHGEAQTAAEAPIKCGKKKKEGHLGSVLLSGSNRRHGATVRYLNEAVATSMMRTVPEGILGETVPIVEQCYRDIEIESEKAFRIILSVSEGGPSNGTLAYGKESAFCNEAPSALTNVSACGEISCVKRSTMLRLKAIWHRPPGP